VNDNEQNRDADRETASASRPNARYRLSRETGGGEELTFHYSREHRLEKAPQPVRDLYREEAPPRFNLLRPLIGSRPRAMMFGSIAFICVVILFLSVFGNPGGAYSLAGNTISAQARKYEGALIVTLKKRAAKGAFFSGGDAYTGAVDVAVSPALRAGAPNGEAGDTMPVFFHRVFFSLEQAEEYRFSVPFDCDELAMVLQTETHTLSLTIKLE
jgi:hypothetical protein